MAVDSAGNLYIADLGLGNGRFRKVAGGMITTVAGNGAFAFSGDGGPATSASFDQPAGVAVDSAGGLYIAVPSAEPLARTDATPTVTIGGKAAQVSFSGLTPQYAGLYQINAEVPTGIATGDAVPVVISISGQTSPVVTMAQ